MRNILFVAAACLVVHAGQARAQQPPSAYPYPYPYPYPVYPTQGLPPPPVIQQQPPPVQQQPPPPAQGPTVIIQSPIPVVVQPVPAAPPPPPPAAPVQQPAPGYYYPPPGWAAPIYSYPPPGYRAAPPPPVYRGQPVQRRPAAACNGHCPGWNQQQTATRPATPDADRARFFSIGLRLSALSINQSIGDKNTTLGGAGLELRFRSRGRFGLEASIDSLHGEFNQGGSITRDTIPLQLSLLMYVFPNADSRHFNIYFLAGGGVASTKMGLIDPLGLQVEQQFREWDLHLGVGTELRFKWLALRADVRGMKLWRDDRDNDGQWYGDVDGAPVPKTSMGVQGTLGAAVWF